MSGHDTICALGILSTGLVPRYRNTLTLFVSSNKKANDEAIDPVFSHNEDGLPSEGTRDVKQKVDEF